MFAFASSLLPQPEKPAPQPQQAPKPAAPAPVPMEVTPIVSQPAPAPSVPHQPAQPSRPWQLLLIERGLMVAFQVSPHREKEAFAFAERIADCREPDQDVSEPNLLMVLFIGSLNAMMPPPGRECSKERALQRRGCIARSCRW
jgi:hypothetical protein